MGTEEDGRGKGWLVCGVCGTDDTAVKGVEAETDGSGSFKGLLDVVVEATDVTAVGAMAMGTDKDVGCKCLLIFGGEVVTGATAIKGVEAGTNGSKSFKGLLCVGATAVRAVEMGISVRATGATVVRTMETGAEEEVAVGVNATAGRVVDAGTEDFVGSE